jgi:hypothetical protein
VSVAFIQDGGGRRPPLQSVNFSGRRIFRAQNQNNVDMPKLSKNKKKVIEGLLREMGSSKSMADSILQCAQAETEQEGVSATKELHRVLLEDLRQQKKQGIRFNEADLQEFLG